MFLSFMSIIEIVFVILSDTKHTELYLKSRGFVKLYLDGYYVQDINKLSEETYFHVLPENISHISIEIRNNPERSFIVSASDGTIISDHKWKCVAREEENLWFLPDFAMKNPYWGSHINVIRTNKRIMNFSSHARLIWPKGNSCCDAFCTYKLGNRSSVKLPLTAVNDGTIGVFLIGQGIINLFQDGAWITNLKSSNVSEISDLRIIELQIDRRADLFSVSINVSNLKSLNDNGDNSTRSNLPLFTFAIFSEHGELTTEDENTTWRCSDDVGATRHGASESWQWKDFYDAHWLKPIFYDLTMEDRLLLNNENETKLKNFFRYFGQSDVEVKTFRWLWSAKHPWSKVIYCRYHMPKSTGHTNSPSEHEDVEDIRLKRSDVSGDPRNINDDNGVGGATVQKIITEITEIPRAIFLDDDVQKELKDLNELTFIINDVVTPTSMFTTVADDIGVVGYATRNADESTNPTKITETDHEVSQLVNGLDINLKQMFHAEGRIISNLSKQVDVIKKEIDNFAYDDYVFEHGIELFITAIDDLILFVDGYQLPFDERRSIEQAAHFILDPFSRVLAVQAASFGARAGILASGGRRHHLNTNKRWLCTSRNPGLGWEKNDFDDGGWPSAIEIAPNEGDTGRNHVRLVRKDAFWIWAVDVVDKNQNMRNDLSNDEEKKTKKDHLKRTRSGYETAYCRFHFDWLNEDQKRSQQIFDDDGRSILSSCKIKAKPVWT